MSNFRDSGPLVADGLQRRSDARRDCSIASRISTRNGDISCLIHNLSASGAGIRIDSASQLRVGESVRFITGPLAGVSAVVRWISAPRYGLQFDSGAAASSIASALFRSLPGQAG